MPRPFVFTEARLRKLDLPLTGRVYHRDSQCRGLQFCLSAAGGAAYYLVKRVDGRPVRMRLGTTAELSLSAAREAAAVLLAQIATGRDPQQERRGRREEPTIANAWEHRKLYATVHCRPKTARENAWRYNRYLSPWAGRRLASITRGEVQQLHNRIGQEHGVYQANQVFALLRWMFNHAEEIGYRGDNPTRRIKAFRERSRDRFLQAPELQTFFRALEAEAELVRDYFMLLLLTGARKNNVRAMAWADVDLEVGYWRIPETKSGLPVVVPLVDPARAILHRRRGKMNDSLWVFPGRKGKHVGALRTPWERIRKAAGLSDVRQHDLRRSLGSWMAGSNASLPIIGRMLGHTTPAATAVYGRLALDPIREAAERATTAMLVAGGVKLLTHEGKGDGNTGGNR